jgi:amino acid permease
VLSKIFIGVYGEIEFALAILTILLIVGIILMGLVIDLDGLSGQQRIGFRYWTIQVHSCSTLKSPAPGVVFSDSELS